MGFDDFGKQVPSCGPAIEWVQDDIAAGWIIKLSGIAAVRVRDDGSITSREGARQDLANSRALTGACCAQYFEVLGLVEGRHQVSDQGDLARDTHLWFLAL